MFFLFFFVLAWIAWGVHVLVRGRSWTALKRLELAIVYQFVLSLALTGLIGFTGHTFNPVQTAVGIGWPAHPQFQFELAAFELGYALASILVIWIRQKYYWLGVVFAPTIFFWLAAVQHVNEMIAKGNFSPYNSLIVLPDVLVPLALVVLIAVYFRWTK